MAATDVPQLIHLTGSVWHNRSDNLCPIQRFTILHKSMRTRYRCKLTEISHTVPQVRVLDSQTGRDWQYILTLTGDCKKLRQIFKNNHLPFPGSWDILNWVYNNNLGCLITQGQARGFRILRHSQGRIKSMSNGYP